MQDHVGFNEQGTIVFDPGNLLVIGAYREDEEDAVYWNYGQPGGFAVTNTHFYEPDGGENWHFVVLGATYENAYQKALKYIYGGYELRVPYPGASIIECYDAPTNLFEWYKNGSIYYKGFIDMTVPAHVHGDRHWPDLDTYEEWMNNPTVYNNYTASTGLSQGNIFDLSN
ncbi:MAG: hypothetical protein ROY99_04940 [Ignavibacterium sp.]|nr:hypothetical protein [Ignavibacterium sp.]